MSFRDQLSEPWGILAAGLIGGLGGAVTAALAPVALLGVPVGVGIAAVVYGVRVSLGAAFDRTPGRGAELGAARRLPRPPRGSPAYGWLRRAEAVIASLRAQTDSEPDLVLRGHVSDVDDRAEAVFADLVRFAGQVTLIDEAAARINAAALYREREDLRRSLSQGSVSVRGELESSLRSVDEQLAAHQRLLSARDGLLAKMQATVLGLEGLLVRLAELSTMHAASDTVGDTADRIRSLSDDLDGLRSGLADAEALSRRILAGGPPPGG